MYPAPLQKTFVGFRMLQGGRWDLQTGPGTGVAGEGRGTFRSFSSQNPREELQAGGGSPGHREAPRLRPPEQPRRAIHSLDSLQASSGGATSSRRVGTDRQFCRLVQIIQVDQSKQVGRPTSFPPAGTSCPLLASTGMTAVSFRDSP